jgi:hypothetical protein
MGNLSVTFLNISRTGGIANLGGRTRTVSNGETPPGPRHRYFSFYAKLSRRDAGAPRFPVYSPAAISGDWQSGAHPLCQGPERSGRRRPSKRKGSLPWDFKEQTGKSLCLVTLFTVQNHGLNAPISRPWVRIANVYANDFGDLC